MTHKNPETAKSPAQRRSRWVRTQRNVGHAGLGRRGIMTSDVVHAVGGHTSLELVEVPGIEPGSSGGLPGLLRAQFALSLLGPNGHANKPL